jgi:ABC-type transport system involved in multi-copper enzyme maturation permease subunit
MNKHTKEILKIEIFKLFRNRINYVYIAAVLITPIVSSFGLRMIENTKNSGTGYSYVLLSLQTLSTMIIPIMLLLFAASTVSSEKTTGTIRNILVSGYSKAQFISSKIIASLIFLLILMSIAATTTILIGYFSFGFGNITEDGFLILKQSQFWINFLISYSLLAIALFAVISFGIMVSTIAQNNISSITIAIGSYILLEGIKTKLHIENYIYSSYIEFPLNMLGDLTEGFYSTWMPKLSHFLLVSSLWIFISLFISFFVIKKIDFK